MGTYCLEIPKPVLPYPFGEGWCVNQSTWATYPAVHRYPRAVVIHPWGRGKFFFAIFVANFIFAKGMQRKDNTIISCCILFSFCMKQHKVPGKNYLRK